MPETHFYRGCILVWDSFILKSKKFILTKTFNKLALVTCSECKFDSELIFSMVILNSIKFEIFKFNNSESFGTTKCPVCIKIPWIGSNS